MYGKKATGPDFGKIQRAIQVATSATGVKNLAARPKDGLIEIHGMAETSAARFLAFRLIGDTLGETSSIVNLIQIPTA